MPVINRELVSKYEQCVVNMNVRPAERFAIWFGNWPHLLLAGHLLMLHALAFGGWRIPAVSLLWLVALGLFLIWQPFVAGEQRISPRQGFFLLAAVLLSTLFLGPWLLLIWCGALAAAIGGRGLWAEQRRERTGYLLALGYLIAVTVLGVVPEISPAVQLDAELRGLLARFLPVFLPLLLLFPARAQPMRTGESFDLFYGILVFLVMAVFVLGALAYMLVGGAGYVESLFKTSMTLAAALLVVAWVWNPRAGFSGVGAAVSRYLLSVGMPLEQWLVHLSQESDRYTDPWRFLEAVMRRLKVMPRVVGASWQAENKRGGYGEPSAYVHSCQANSLTLILHFRQPPSPAMRWHVEWLLRLAIEFYLVKKQADQLQKMGYVQAIYETGARVTHDVKNLLQSLQVLCYAAARPGDPAEVAGLLRRQLPQIVERLKATLEKLQSPRISDDDLVDARAWWRSLQDRYAGLPITWDGEPASDARIPGALFDSVAENLLQNALSKRQREPGLVITACISDVSLRVVDNGSAIGQELVAGLLKSPVASEDGLGIGLYHAAGHAEALAYCLELLANHPGQVEFSLSPRPEQELPMAR